MKARVLIVFSLTVFGMFPAFAVDDVALNAYEKLNYRLSTDPEFAQLVQTEVVGFGVAEQNKGIFIVVDPLHANQENLDDYEEIFRDTIGENIPVLFEIRERADSQVKKDPDVMILVLVIIPVFCITIYYFWRKRK